MKLKVAHEIFRKFLRDHPEHEAELEAATTAVGTAADAHDPPMGPPDEADAGG